MSRCPACHGTGLVVAKAGETAAVTGHWTVNGQIIRLRPCDAEGCCNGEVSCCDPPVNRFQYERESE